MSKRAVVPGQVRMSAFVPRMNRQRVKQSRCGGAIGDRERVAGEELVSGKLRLEHSVRHIEPSPRPLNGAVVEALLDRVGDDRRNGIGDVLVADTVPQTSL